MTAMATNLSEIQPLSQNAVAKFIAARKKCRPHDICRRQLARWPFPGAAELWLCDADGIERYSLATCVNLSFGGVGLRMDEQLSVGTELGIAVHQPEVSFHGRAVVRHCTLASNGEFLAGLEFLYGKQKC